MALRGAGADAWYSWLPIRSLCVKAVDGSGGGKGSRGSRNNSTRALQLRKLNTSAVVDDAAAGRDELSPKSAGSPTGLGLGRGSGDAEPDADREPELERERTAASGADADAVDARESADAAEPDAETTAGPRLTVSSAGRGGD
jgi:hypothetical protein